MVAKLINAKAATPAITTGRLFKVRSTVLNFLMVPLFDSKPYPSPGGEAYGIVFIFCYGPSYFSLSAKASFTI
jgi:hypothetical protein